ncbi:uncharacterized protein [Drosophila bipectinata]|uniref:uncharacterized protein n=1 Tax=Drosophila bipectinata TaxID=42026 RepID=UPI001C8A0A44|nr:uncharacterized protein LOC108120211 [Drosophila bipectinata]
MFSARGLEFWMLERLYQWIWLLVWFKDQSMKLIDRFASNDSKEDDRSVYEEFFSDEEDSTMDSGGDSDTEYAWNSDFVDSEDYVSEVATDTGISSDYNNNNNKKYFQGIYDAR